MALWDSSLTEPRRPVIAADPVFGVVDVLRIHAPVRYRYCYVGEPVRALLEAAEVTGVRFGTAKLFR